MGHEAKITSKGQLTLPVELREQLRLQTGDHVEFLVDHLGRIVMRPRNLPASAVLGALKPRRPLASIKSDAAAVAESVSARDKRSRRRKSHS